MAITINIYYTGVGNAAKNFVREMIDSGTADAIKKEEGNLRYDYFFPVEDGETVLLIDSWENQEALDAHHQTPMMNVITELREKYDLHMKIERYISDETVNEKDKKYIKE